MFVNATIGMVVMFQVLSVTMNSKCCEYHNRYDHDVSSSVVKELGRGNYVIECKAQALKEIFYVKLLLSYISSYARITIIETHV